MPTEKIFCPHCMALYGKGHPLKHVCADIYICPTCASQYDIPGLKAAYRRARNIQMCKADVFDTLLQRVEA